MFFLKIFSIKSDRYSRVKHEWQITKLWSAKAPHRVSAGRELTQLKGCNARATAPRELPAAVWCCCFCPHPAKLQLVLCLNRFFSPKGAPQVSLWDLDEDFCQVCLSCSWKPQLRPRCRGWRHHGPAHDACCIPTATRKGRRRKARHQALPKEVRPFTG